MNSITIKKLISILLLIVAFTACVEDDDFNTPALIIESLTFPENSTFVQIDGILGDLAQAQNNDGEDATVTFEVADQYLEGYVISSDRSGNFFEELVIQDATETPNAGVRILIDVNPLFITYQFGRKVFIDLEGLSIGIENGVATLGILSGNEVGQIPSFSVEDIITRSAEVATITPLEISIEDFDDTVTNLFVRINNVQFNKNDVLVNNPLTFAGEPSDEFDGERNLESCESGARAVLSTSTFADFKSVSLPTQRGSFEGVLSRNFFGDTFNLILNDATGLLFDNENRCDPDVLECEGVSGGSNIIFEENFTGVSISDLENTGWLNENITGGTLDYVVGNFSGNLYAQITGFNTGENPFEVWLVTPEIDVTAFSAEELSFDVQSSFDNGSILTTFITNDFTGDITTTEWTQLDTRIPTGPSGGFGDFNAVAPINISCLDGSIRVGFRYAGADPGSTTRYHIDNIEISGN